MKMTKEELLNLGWVTPTDIHNLLPRISIQQIRFACKKIRQQMINDGKQLPYGDGRKLVVPAKKVLKEFDI